MTDNHHTPERADGLRRTVANLLATHQIPTDLVASPGGNFKTKWTDNWEDCTDAVMALIAAEVHASNRRLLLGLKVQASTYADQPDSSAESVSAIPVSAIDAELEKLTTEPKRGLMDDPEIQRISRGEEA